MKIKFFIYMVFPFLIACPLPDQDEKIDSTIVFINHSKIDILYLDYNQFQYPDTNFVVINPFSDTSSLEYQYSLIKSKTTKSFPGSYIEGFKINPNKLMIFLFSKDTVAKVPWVKIKNDYNILKRYDFGLKELETINWTIEYKLIFLICKI